MNEVTESNPWTILASHKVYENPWISLTEHQVLNPAGNPGIYGTVHFKNQAVGVVPYQEGFIWMVGQYRFPLKKFYWEIPEGGGPFEEDPAHTALRELQEETGLTAQKVTPLFQMHLSNSVSDEWGIVYLATELSQGQASPEETEALTVKKMSLDEVYEEIEAGRITDSLTVAAIYKLMILKLQGKL
ncbi:MAG: NUDIX hydrolase [Bacteroidia bacterium]|nr:NUDIX hydrolase [Bacteroidia bacterium]